jgi:hypothetical protein
MRFCSPDCLKAYQRREALTQDEIEEIRATCAAKARRARNGAQKEASKKIKVAVTKAVS